MLPSADPALISDWMDDMSKVMEFEIFSLAEPPETPRPRETAQGQHLCESCWPCMRRASRRMLCPKRLPDLLQTGHHVQQLCRSLLNQNKTI